MDGISFRRQALRNAWRQQAGLGRLRTENPECVAAEPRLHLREHGAVV